jgi:hypothetical protein
MRIEREWLRNLIFEGRDGRRFTQDSPILPDVWLAGGLFYCADPAARVDLILTPYNGCSPNRLAAKVRARLNALRESHEREHAAGKTETARRLRGVYQPDEKNPWGDKREEQRVLLKPTPRVAVNQTNVVVSVTLEELIVVVLPLSLWWRRNVAPPDDPNDDMMPKLSRVPSEKQSAAKKSRNPSLTWPGWARRPRFSVRMRPGVCVDPSVTTRRSLNSFCMTKLRSGTSSKRCGRARRSCNAKASLQRLAPGRSGRVRARPSRT